jgi:hypothetical protein
MTTTTRCIAARRTGEIALQSFPIGRLKVTICPIVTSAKVEKADSLYYANGMDKVNVASI